MVSVVLPCNCSKAIFVIAADKKLSDTRPQKANVPQGRILEPPFNLYVNDIVNIDDDVRFIMYADN